MSEGCSFRVAFSPTATLASIHRQPAKTCFFHLCTAVMVPKFEPCYPLKSWRAGTFKEPMVVEAEADTSRYAEEVDEFPYSQMKQEGEMEEEKVEALDSQEDCFRRKKKKTDGLKIINYDRFKMNNGREVYEEKAYLVGVESKGTEADNIRFEESLKELAQLADTAGLLVVGSTYQKLSDPNPRTYIGSGKVTEIKNAVRALGVETVIFDDELSAGQLRNLEKAFGGDIRVCDRTSLILDIFNQRAATHEAALQVSLAQMEYQLPRLTKMWSHLERQAGGKVKGMGEKQIEVDKRILRTKIGALRKELESVRKHRKLYRNRRLSVPIPVVSLVGYTNAGKSTLLNRLTGANVLAEDCLFATLDPTTRKVQMNNGRPFLLTDTVGFIQKLPTTLVAAFRATLEEISESSLLVHVVDISHRLAQKQADVVEKVLQELDAALIPKLIVWNKVLPSVHWDRLSLSRFYGLRAWSQQNCLGNKSYYEGIQWLTLLLFPAATNNTCVIDQAINPSKIRCQAEKKGIICISAFYGDGLEEFCNAVQTKLRDSMVSVDAFVPYGEEDLLSTIRHVGIIEETEYLENGTRVRAHVPLPLSRSLTPVRQYVASSTLL